MFVLTVPLPAPLAAQTQPTQQDEFMPIDQLPPQEQLPAAPLLDRRLRVRPGGAVRLYVVSVARRLDARAARGRIGSSADLKRTGRGLMPTAAHFLYIPGVLLVGIVIGWILGSRAAADAYAAQLRRQRQAQSRKAASTPTAVTASSADS